MDESDALFFAAAFFLQFHPGQCPNTKFFHGGHRAGMVPVLSVMDGGLPGDSCRAYCVDCGKRLKGVQSVFIPLAQPSTFPQLKQPALPELSHVAS